MPRSITFEKLTLASITALRCPAGAKYDILWDCEDRGLGVRVTPKGTKTFILQLRVDGTQQERQQTLGRFPAMTLAAARIAAKDASSSMMKGIDPVPDQPTVDAQAPGEDAQFDPFRITLSQVMEKYLATRATDFGPLRPATQANIRSHVKNQFADWKDRPIALLTRDECLDKFNALSAKAKTQTNNAFRTLRALCNFACELFTTEGGEPVILAANPVKRMIKLRKRLNPNRVRIVRIELHMIGTVWKALDLWRASGRLTARARSSVDFIQFAILTACRVKEGTSIPWSGVNFARGTITFDGEITKNHLPLKLPMSPALRKLLQDRHSYLASIGQESSKFVWASAGKLGHITDAREALEYVSQIAGEHIHTHDLRRTFEDVAQTCKVDPDKRRVLLNHKCGDVHGVHYANNPELLQEDVDAIAGWIMEQAGMAPDVPLPAPKVKAVSPHLKEWKALPNVELERLVWTMSSAKIAKQFGVTDVAVFKRCKARGIAKPVRGFWTQVEFGRLPNPNGRAPTAPGRRRRSPLNAQQQV